MSNRQARWLEFLAEFDFEVIHRPGKSNVVVDALSRLYQMECFTISELEMAPKLLKVLKKDYEQDEETHKFLENLGSYPQFKVVN